MFSSCANQSFFGKVRKRAKSNYLTNEQLIAAPTQLISKTFGSVVSSALLNGAGTIVDQYWQPAENFPPLFATIGLLLGFIAPSPQFVIKLSCMPINALVSLMDAFGEELVIAMSDRSDDFKVGFNYCNDALTFRYCEVDGYGEIIQREPDVKPSHFLGMIAGGLLGPRYMPHFFNKIANFAVPFASKIGFATETLVSPLASVAGYVVSRPAAKTLAFAGGLLTIPFGRLYRFVRKNSNEESDNSPGKMLEDQEYRALVVNGPSRSLRSHTAT